MIIRPTKELHFFIIEMLFDEMVSSIDFLLRQSLDQNIEIREIVLWKSRVLPKYFWSRYHDRKQSLQQHTQLHIWQHYDGFLIWWICEWCIFHKMNPIVFFFPVKISSLVAIWIANKSAIFSLMNRWHNIVSSLLYSDGTATRFLYSTSQILYKYSVWDLHVLLTSLTLQSISGIVQVKLVLQASN